MNDLKSIWNQVSRDSGEVEMKMTNPKESIFAKLKYEQHLRDKFNPILVVFIILFTLFFSYIELHNSPQFGVSKIVGIICVTLASISIAIFSQIVKMPLHHFEHDKSSMIFFKNC